MTSSLLRSCNWPARERTLSFVSLKRARSFFTSLIKWFKCIVGGSEKDVKYEAKSREGFANMFCEIVYIMFPLVLFQYTRGQKLMHFSVWHRPFKVFTAARHIHSLFSIRQKKACLHQTFQTSGANSNQLQRLCTDNMSFFQTHMDGCNKGEFDDH